MKSRIIPVVVLPLLLLVSDNARAHAQDGSRPPATVAARTPADTLGTPPGGFRPLRVAKWSALAGSAGAGIFGFIQNERADKQLRQLEQLCSAEPARCQRRSAGGAYEDPEFNARHQQIRSLDRDSHVALLMSQIGVAATVVLFVLDLGNVRRPPDIPFVPRGVSVQPQADGRVSLELRVPLNGHAR